MMEMFDWMSIEANKLGRKSEKQVQEILFAFRPAKWYLAAGSFLAVIGWFIGSSAGTNVSIFGWILKIVGIFAALRGFSRLIMRSSLLADQLNAEDGIVEFEAGVLASPGIFAAKTQGDRKLYPQGLAGMSSLLPPGKYRFHYLNTRSWLLSAEPLSTEQEMKHSLNMVLCDVFGFDQFTLFNYRTAAREGSIKVVEGLAELDWNSIDTEYSNWVEIKLGGENFRIPTAAIGALLPNIPYRAYYVDEREIINVIEVAC